MELTIRSNCKAIGLYNIPKSNQDHNLMFIRDSNWVISIKEIKDIIKVLNSKIQEKILTPSYPNFLPKKPQNKELNKGNKRVSMYI